MALFGKIDHLAEVLAADARFASGFSYLRRCLASGSADQLRIAAIPPDKVEEVALELGSVAFDQVYHTRDRRDCFFESHQKFIDIQCIFEGEEVIDVIGVGGLKIDMPYDPEKDLIKYSDPGIGSRLILRAGQAAIFFPEDGHMPGQTAQRSSLVRKTVVKVPIGNG